MTTWSRGDVTDPFAAASAIFLEARRSGRLGTLGSLVPTRWRMSPDTRVLFVTAAVEWYQLVGPDTERLFGRPIEIDGTLPRGWLELTT